MAAAVAAAVAREVALIAAYDAASRSAPAATVLIDFGSHHREHLARLRSLGPAVQSAAAPASPSSLSTSTPLTPAAIRALFASIAGKERSAGDAGALACATAGPTPFAELLAEIAGNEAQHAALLPGFPIPAAR
ncbi:MAG: hypothetical protein ABI912_09250 [Actinomycetota bacterium]